MLLFCCYLAIDVHIAPPKNLLAGINFLKFFCLFLWLLLVSIQCGLTAFWLLGWGSTSKQSASLQHAFLYFLKRVGGAVPLTSQSLCRTKEFVFFPVRQFWSVMLGSLSLYWAAQVMVVFWNCRQTWKWRYHTAQVCTVGESIYY